MKLSAEMFKHMWISAGLGGRKLGQVIFARPSVAMRRTKGRRTKPERITHRRRPRSERDFPSRRQWLRSDKRHLMITARRNASS